VGNLQIGELTWESKTGPRRIEKKSKKKKAKEWNHQGGGRRSSWLFGKPKEGTLLRGKGSPLIHQEEQEIIERKGDGKGGTGDLRAERGVFYAERVKHAVKKIMREKKKESEGGSGFTVTQEFRNAESEGRLREPKKKKHSGELTKSKGEGEKGDARQPTRRHVWGGFKGTRHRRRQKG